MPSLPKREKKNASAAPETTVASERILPASPEDYNAFVAGVDLRTLRLAHCLVDARSRYAGASLTPEVEEGGTSFANIDRGFTVVHEMRFTGRPSETGTMPVEISATFELEYSSEEPMNDSLFEIFHRHNLPVNVWPFFREFVHTVLARANWPVFVLPALKVVPTGRPRRQRVSQPA